MRTTIGILTTTFALAWAAASAAQGHGDLIRQPTHRAQDRDLKRALQCDDVVRGEDGARVVERARRVGERLRDAGEGFWRHALN